MAAFNEDQGCNLRVRSCSCLSAHQPTLRVPLAPGAYRLHIAHARIRLSSEMELSLERAECATEEDISSSRLELAPSPRPDVNFRKICRPQLGLDLLYCPSFYDKSAADLVFQQLETQLSPFFSRCQQTVTLAGRVQPIPRRHTAFGDPGLSYSFSGITMRANPLVSSLLGSTGTVNETSNQLLPLLLSRSDSSGTLSSAIRTPVEGVGEGEGEGEGGERESWSS